MVMLFAYQSVVLDDEMRFTRKNVLNMEAYCHHQRDIVRENCELGYVKRELLALNDE